MANWQTIIDREDLSKQMIAQIENTYIPIWQKELDKLTEIKSTVYNVNTIFTSRFGSNAYITDIPEKYRSAYQHTVDLKSVANDMVRMVELNLRMKQETIKAIQNKNAAAAVTAANDEDRITLVLSWYNERLETLLKDNETVARTLKDLITEYPR